MHRTRSDNGLTWTLEPCCFKVIGLSESQMQAVTMMLTNKSCTFIVHIPIISTLKLEPHDDNVFKLFDYDEDLCPTLDLSNTFHEAFVVIDQRPPSFINIGIHLKTNPNT